ncbi:MAG: cobalamin-binding protein [Candidatus Binatia bacterium]
MSPATAEPRIVSLIASSTEIVHALGFGDRLVGRSHECDFPETVKALPAVTEPKFPVEGTSYEIDQRVKAILQEGLSVYRVHADQLRALRPDVVLTQSQCEVCAVSLRDVEQAVCEWIDSRPKIVSLEPNALADIFRDIRKVAAALEAPERGDELVGRLERRIAEVAGHAKSAGGLPTVAAIEWIDPLMACGNWMPELVELGGGANLFGVAGKHSPWMSFDEIREQDPEVIVVLPCGFDIPRTRAEMPKLTEHIEWAQLRAVREGRVAIADGNQYFNRPGPRVVESLEILAEILHPGAIDYGWKGRGWEPWP